MKEIILYEKPDGAVELFIDGNKITNVNFLLILFIEFVIKIAEGLDERKFDK